MPLFQNWFGRRQQQPLPQSVGFISPLEASAWGPIPLDPSQKQPYLKQLHDAVEALGMAQPLNLLLRIAGDFKEPGKKDAARIPVDFEKPKPGQDKGDVSLSFGYPTGVMLILFVDHLRDCSDNGSRLQTSMRMFNSLCESITGSGKAMDASLRILRTTIERNTVKAYNSLVKEFSS